MKNKPVLAILGQDLKKKIVHEILYFFGIICLKVALKGVNFWLHFEIWLHFAKKRKIGHVTKLKSLLYLLISTCKSNFLNLNFAFFAVLSSETILPVK